MTSGRSKDSKTEAQAKFFKISQDDICRFIREHRETLEKIGRE